MGKRVGINSFPERDTKDKKKERILSNEATKPSSRSVPAD